MSVQGGGEESERKRELLLNEECEGGKLWKGERAVTQVDARYTRLTSILNH